MYYKCPSIKKIIPFGYYELLKSLILTLLVFLQFNLFSQTITHPSSGTSTTTVNCGTTYTYYDAGGTSPYAANESGVLVLTPSDLSKSVQIDFTGIFDIETHATCNYDFIRVYNGSSTAAPLIGKFCNSNLPGLIKASMNGSLTVLFDSDGGVQGAGWVATVTCENTNAATVNMPSGTNVVNACSGSFFDSGGSGSDYSDGEGSTITFNPGNDVTMIFSAFNVEAHATCGYDYMSIYDGPTTASPLIGTYCGTNSPGTITSTNGSLTVYFDSDGGATEAGWEATWTCCSVSGGSITASADPICSGSSSTLTLSGHDGSATLLWQSSPDGSTWSNIGGATSANYSASPTADTYYRVRVTNGCTVYSTTHLLDVSNPTAGTISASTNTLCSGSSVTLSLAGSSGSIQWQSSPDGSSWSNVGGATGTTYSPSPGSNTYYRARVSDAPCSNVFSATELVNIVFCVNMQNGSTTNCIGNLYDDGGLSSNYAASRDYTYVINPGGTVTITFNTFDVETHASCSFDYLRIYDGPNTSSTLLGTWCNSTGSPGTIVSSGGALTFVWHSDSGTERPGWDASWSCCGVVAGTPTVSPSSMCVAGNVNLSLAGYDGGATIQWQSSSNGTTWSNIIGATSNTEVVVAASSTYYRAKVTNSCDTYSSTNFVLVGGAVIPTNYYVNDNSVVGDVYCNNIGNPVNNGRNPCTPKTTLQDVFDTYNIEPGDTIFVDAGTYTMGLNVVNSDQGSAAFDVVIIGAGKLLTHITATAADDNIYLTNVSYTFVRGLHLISSQASNYNYYLFEGNDNHVYDCHLEHSSNTNIYLLEGGNTIDIDDNDIAYCEIDNTSSSGFNIWIRGDADDNTVQYCSISSTGTAGAKAIVLNDYATGLHDGWPTAIHMYRNTIVADDYGFYGEVVDGNTMETYDIHDNKIIITSSDRTDGAAIWINDHGLSSGSVSNIFNNIITGGKNGVYFADGVDYVHLYNNFICNVEYGVYIAADNSNDNDYQHNSIYSSKDCIYFTSNSKGSTNLRNNIFYTTGNSSYACVNAGSTSSTFIRSDYNIYYMPNGAYAAKEGASNYTLAGWQGTDHHDGAGNGDVNSIQTNPNYRNASACQLELNGNYQTGVTLGTISTDLFGFVRVNPTIGAWEEGSTLPVISTAANAFCEDNVITFKWNSVSEVNNNFYMIEGSVDGENYQELTIIDGAGNSNTELWYEEELSIVESKFKFFKLSQVDFEGVQRTLKNLIVECDLNNEFNILSLYPNPAGEMSTLALSAPFAMEVNINIIDLNGRSVYVDNNQIEKGLSYINLNLEKLAASVYIVVVKNDNGESVYEKLIVE